MITYEKSDMYVQVTDTDNFGVSLDNNPLHLSRAELEDLRCIIDQALNTSQAELDAA